MRITFANVTFVVLLYPAALLNLLTPMFLKVKPGKRNKKCKSTQRVYQEMYMRKIPLRKTNKSSNSTKESRNLRVSLVTMS